MNGKIVIIDNDKKLNQLLKAYLYSNGFETKTASDLNFGLALVQAERPDLIILDFMLPEIRLIQEYREIRKRFNIPILLLTDKGELADRIPKLNLGIDDYLPKPFDPKEFVRRIQMLILQNERNSGASAVVAEEIAIEPDQRAAKINGSLVHLTESEFHLLALLLKNSGEVVDRDMIFNNVKGSDWNVYDRSADILVCRLRQKIEDNPRKPKYIKTVWGYGYKYIGAEVNEAKD